MITTILTSIGTSIGTIITYLVGKEFIIPQIIQLWQFLFDRKIAKENHELDNKQKEVDIMEASNNAYEGQIEFLTKEVKELQEENKKIREDNKKIIDNLYNQEIELAKFRSLCCKNIDCINRETCDCDE